MASSVLARRTNATAVSQSAGHAPCSPRPPMPPSMNRRPRSSPPATPAGTAQLACHQRRSATPRSCGPSVTEFAGVDRRRPRSGRSRSGASQCDGGRFSITLRRTAGSMVPAPSATALDLLQLLRLVVPGASMALTEQAGDGVDAHPGIEFGRFGTDLQLEQRLQAEPTAELSGHRRTRRRAHQHIRGEQRIGGYRAIRRRCPAGCRFPRQCAAIPPPARHHCPRLEVTNAELCQAQKSQSVSGML